MYSGQTAKWEADENVWKSREFLSWMYNESPVKDRVVTYDRWGSGVRFTHGAVYTPEYQPDLDFEDHYWEESRGMGFSYGYNREEDAWDYNSSQSLVLQLIDKVSRVEIFYLISGRMNMVRSRPSCRKGFCKWENG